MNHGQHEHKRTAFIALSGCRITLILGILVLLTAIEFDGNQPQAAAAEYSSGQQVQTRLFERILTWKESPATSQAVSWRTSSAATAVAEIAVADSSPDFEKHAQPFHATTTELQSAEQKVYYHSVNFSNLIPDTLKEENGKKKFIERIPPDLPERRFNSQPNKCSYKFKRCVLILRQPSSEKRFSRFSPQFFMAS